ncbi:ribosome biogenesis regulatory protein [Phlyctema vagabunda]|uniref:Ribosome biogenesis regulatory protein n=1 Tax=Phlyctema vagabunda TaxID=108571 RepID=A0ABR4P3S8_9HELO
MASTKSTSAAVAAAAAASGPSKLPITVQKPTPYTFDLGLLLAEDPNPLVLTTRDNLEQELAATARDGAQALVNQLLSTCPIASTPAGVLLSLPDISTRLPREKPLPPPKELTTWQRFAAKKGIKGKTAETRKKMVYDDNTGEWVPKWGYKGLNKAGEDDWIVEVDPKKEAERKEGTERQGDGRRERKEKVRRNERLQRANDRKSREKGGR